MKKLGKILLVVLTFALLLGIVAVSAFAEDADTGTVDTVEITVGNGEAQQMSYYEAMAIANDPTQTPNGEAVYIKLLGNLTIKNEKTIDGVTYTGAVDLVNTKTSGITLDLNGYKITIDEGTMNKRTGVVANYTTANTGVLETEDSNTKTSLGYGLFNLAANVKLTVEGNGGAIDGEGNAAISYLTVFTIEKGTEEVPTDEATLIINNTDITFVGGGYPNTIIWSRNGYMEFNGCYIATDPSGSTVTNVLRHTDNGRVRFSNCYLSQMGGDSSNDDLIATDCNATVKLDEGEYHIEIENCSVFATSALFKGQDPGAGSFRAGSSSAYRWTEDTQRLQGVTYYNTRVNVVNSNIEQVNYISTFTGSGTYNHLINGGYLEGNFDSCNIIFAQRLILNVLSDENNPGYLNFNNCNIEMTLEGAIKRDSSTNAYSFFVNSGTKIPVTFTNSELTIPVARGTGHFAVVDNLTADATITATKGAKEGSAGTIHYPFKLATNVLFFDNKLVVIGEGCFINATSDSILGTYNTADSVSYTTLRRLVAVTTSNVVTNYYYGGGYYFTNDTVETTLNQDFENVHSQYHTTDVAPITSIYGRASYAVWADGTSIKTGKDSARLQVHNVPDRTPFYTGPVPQGKMTVEEQNGNTFMSFDPTYVGGIDVDGNSTTYGMGAYKASENAITDLASIAALQGMTATTSEEDGTVTAVTATIGGTAYTVYAAWDGNADTTADTVPEYIDVTDDGKTYPDYVNSGIAAPGGTSTVNWVPIPEKFTKFYDTATMYLDNITYTLEELYDSGRTVLVYDWDYNNGNENGDFMQQLIAVQGRGYNNTKTTHDTFYQTFMEISNTGKITGSGGSYSANYPAGFQMTSGEWYHFTIVVKLEKSETALTLTTDDGVKKTGTFYDFSGSTAYFYVNGELVYTDSTIFYAPHNETLSTTIVGNKNKNCKTGTQVLQGLRLTSSGSFGDSTRFWCDNINSSVYPDLSAALGADNLSEYDEKVWYNNPLRDFAGDYVTLPTYAASVRNEDRIYQPYPDSSYVDTYGNNKSGLHWAIQWAGDHVTNYMTVQEAFLNAKSGEIIELNTDAYGIEITKPVTVITNGNDFTFYSENYRPVATTVVVDREYLVDGNGVTYINVVEADAIEFVYAADRYLTENEFTVNYPDGTSDKLPHLAFGSYPPVNVEHSSLEYGLGGAIDEEAAVYTLYYNGEIAPAEIFELGFFNPIVDNNSITTYNFHYDIVQSGWAFYNADDELLLKGDDYDVLREKINDSAAVTFNGTLRFFKDYSGVYTLDFNYSYANNHRLYIDLNGHTIETATGYDFLNVASRAVVKLTEIDDADGDGITGEVTVYYDKNAPTTIDTTKYTVTHSPSSSSMYMNAVVYSSAPGALIDANTAYAFRVYAHNSHQSYTCADGTTFKTALTDSLIAIGNEYVREGITIPATSIQAAMACGPKDETIGDYTININAGVIAYTSGYASSIFASNINAVAIGTSYALHLTGGNVFMDGSTVTQVNPAKYVIFVGDGNENTVFTNTVFVGTPDANGNCAYLFNSAGSKTGYDVKIGAGCALYNIKLGAATLKTKTPNDGRPFAVEGVVHNLPFEEQNVKLQSARYYCEEYVDGTDTDTLCDTCGKDEAFHTSASVTGVIHYDSVTKYTSVTANNGVTYNFCYMVTTADKADEAIVKNLPQITASHNISLNSSFKYNFYLDKAGVDAATNLVVTLNYLGTDYTFTTENLVEYTDDSGNSYYVAELDGIGSDSIGESIKIDISYTDAESVERAGTMTVSIVSYVQAAIQSAADEDLAVLKSVIAYANAAYQVFGGDTYQGMVLRALETLYPVTVTKVTGTTGEGIDGVTAALDLGTSVKFVFTMANNGQTITLKVGGVDAVVNEQYEIVDADGNYYVIVDLRAYQLGEELELTVNGENFVYSLAHYAAAIEAHPELTAAEKAEIKTLLDALNTYAAAAKAAEATHN